MKRDVIANVLLQDEGGYALSKVKDLNIAQLKLWRSVGVKTAQVMDRPSDGPPCGSEFFFEYTLDEDDLFENLFWADPISHSDYGYFCNVLAFDATYKTNVYHKPLVMLVGVNHHNCTTIFSFGLLGDETMETYTWLLRIFLVSMYANRIQCSCKLFLTTGISCSQSFSVMKAMNMQDIPSSLILTRWTTSVKHMSDIDCFCEVTLTPTMGMVRYGSLSAKCSKLCYFTSKSNCGFKEANEEKEKLTVRMQELMPCSLLTSETMLGTKGKQHVHNVKDPCIAATKGSSGR
ncbi:hypothetical protein Ddye_023136 [Dipteronia dyeriana]|uniref:MULE transposase domain-containing protein n=1 Tax=Dipteronia dyeriana TaxID=168575 RepID=A0AAD9WSY7_9ROSI|nr:hypothetical protein Ddye_023136 [Dipteronia dyeriana]